MSLLSSNQLLDTYITILKGCHINTIAVSLYISSRGSSLASEATHLSISGLGARVSDAMDGRDQRQHNHPSQNLHLSSSSSTKSGQVWLIYTRSPCIASTQTVMRFTLAVALHQVGQLIRSTTVMTSLDIPLYYCAHGFCYLSHLKLTNQL